MGLFSRSSDSTATIVGFASALAVGCIVMEHLSCHGSALELSSRSFEMLSIHDSLLLGWAI